MSSRGTFLGTGPASGVYTPKPTPQQAEDMPIYINDELLDLGGRLNNILEGGAFPPQSQIPKRVKDGMMIYFTQPIKGSDVSSAGVWLYKKGKWWKIIDDPSAISQNLTVYKKYPKGSNRPPKPPINKYLEADLKGWSYVPTSNDDANDQWMSVATWAITDPDNAKVDWSEPIMFNTEGTAGQPGADGYSIEFRYIASTFKPSIKNNSVLEPETVKGKKYVRSIPGVSHPDENFIWQTQAYLRNGAINSPWTDPIKFSTPDTTKPSSCYSVAKEHYGIFDPGAKGLPGDSWSYPVPANIPTGWNLWRSDRLEWTDGFPQTPWSTPYKASGQVGAKQETRYTASTIEPTILNNKAREPAGSKGEVFTLSLPSTSHPEKSFIWMTSGVVNRLEEMELPWTKPAKYATPDSTNMSTCYAVGGLLNFPNFLPTSEKLPGVDWSKDFPVGLTKDQYIWESTRVEWSSGAPQTNWSNPVRIMGYDGSDGVSFEFRYRASTTRPSIATGDRIPANWSLSVPAVSHPNNSFVWTSSAQVDTLDKLKSPWSAPAKFATPDTTTQKSAYGIGSDSTWPTFNPNASGLPGAGWSYTPPRPGRGQRLWMTVRYQWDDSTGVTAWTPPIPFSGSDGQDGGDGNDGFTLVEVYKNASTKPPEIPDAERSYPPTGWDKVQTTPTLGQVTWSSKNYVRGKIEEATQTTYNYSGVVQISGTPGNDGNPGTDGRPGSDGVTQYNWIMYADTSTGGGISSNPRGKKYVGFAYNMKSPKPSLNSIDYAWYFLEGPQGIPGKPGADGVTFYTWLKYADNASGGGMSDSPLGKLYIGLAYNKLNQLESTDPSVYSWALIKGEAGIAGKPGLPGADGITYYTWIKYANDALGNGMSDLPTGKDYIGLSYNKLTASESNKTSDYTWSKFTGDQGIPGAPGKDGKTTYTWLKYADNASGGGMSDSPVGKVYIGLAFNKVVQTESTNVADYAWSKIHGDQGIPGAPGDDGITYYTWVKYADDNKGLGFTDNPTGKAYLGLAYNKTVQLESTNWKDYSWSLIKGSDGTNGIPGRPGLPGANGITYYTWVKYANDALGNGMSDLPTGKNYIGLAYNKLTSVESNTPGDYTWSKFTGDQGIPGAPGKDGKTTYTWVKYAVNIKGGGLSDSPVGKEYLGLAFNKTVQLESTNPGDYAWSKIHGDQGIPGAPGADGITYYTWIKYADTISGSGMSDSPTGKAYLGLAYNKLAQKESNNPSDYVWSLFKGPPGVTGNPGLPGTPGAGFWRIAMTNFGAWPSQATVDTAFRSEFGRNAEQDDVLTLYDAVLKTRAETRRKDKTGAWVAAAMLVHGDMILRGTIVADNIATGAINASKIVAGSITSKEIKVGSLNGNLITANTAISSPNIIGGQLDIGNGTFKVGTNGALTATSATITGKITSTGGVFTNGTISGSHISAGSSITLGRKFVVDSNGTMTCTGANIGGTLNSVNGIFTGTLQGVNGIFTGTLQGVTGVFSGAMAGGSINVPATNPQFNVDSKGNMICNNATISGSLIHYGELRGTSINVNNKFIVTSDGTTTIQSAPTGSRMVIKNDRIEVWEGATLRVILGRL